MTFNDVPIEAVSRWWDEQPCNSKHADPIHTPLSYSRSVTARRYRREPHNLRFLDPPRWGWSRVLEVGCGIGTDTLALVKSGAYVHAIDLSTESLKIARERARVELNGRMSTHVVFEQWNVEKPFDRRMTKPDLIWSYGVLHHTPHPDKALRNLLDAAKPTTELRIMLYHRWSTKGIRLGLTDRRIARGSEARPSCPVTYAYSRRSARRLLERTGWHVDRIQVDHVRRYRWQDDRVALPWRVLPDIVHRMVSCTLGWHLLITAHPARQGNDG